MKQTGTWIISLVFILLMLGVAAWIYPQLPAQAAIHWDANGVANGWAPRFWAAAVPVMLMVGLALLFAILPVISPRKFEIAPFARVYGIVVLATQAFLLVVGTVALFAGAGHHVSMELVAPVAVGALLIVIGNFMGKFRKNFFIGIRTPWTLTSDVVWERTHRLAGWLFVLAGLAWIVGGLLHVSPAVLVVAALAAGFIPAIYSYFLYRRVEDRPGTG
ncbi:MAG TPA: SdpI family protein [Rhodanobacteraceae bacterium]|nr:SdpI family protein [Rhodanobacteraceae bacterium]